MTQDGWSFLRFIHSVTPSMTSLGHSHLVRRCLLLLLYLLALFCEREGEEVDSTPPPPLLPHTDRCTHLLSMALWDYIDCSGEHNTNLPPPPPFPFPSPEQSKPSDVTSRPTVGTRPHRRPLGCPPGLCGTSECVIPGEPNTAVVARGTCTGKHLLAVRRSDLGWKGGRNGRGLQRNKQKRSKRRTNDNGERW